MTTGLFGLNKYERSSKTEMGLTNFQWTLDGAVARSSQPGYTGSDKPHAFGPVEITYLRSKGINCIISANHLELPKVARTLLTNAGISYYHYQVGDYQPPTTLQLQTAANVMDTAINGGGRVLVHCGYGEGRTGTFVAGWAMLKYMPRQVNADVDDMCNMDFLKPNFGVETPAQMNAVRVAAALAPATVPAANAGFALPIAAFGSGPSGIGLPNTAAPAPKFSSVNTDDIEW